VFSLDTKFPVFASIAIADGMLYFATLDGKFAAVDLKTQKPAWVFQNDTSKQNLPAIQNADGALNFGAIMSQNVYDEMVIAASKLLSVGSMLSSPVVVKDVAYVGSPDGNLYALDQAALFVESSRR
jgi:outer membrane protein assembly factor BamB